MIVKRKNSLQKKRFYTVISASVLVFLIIAYASVNAIIGALSSSSESGSDSDNTTLPEIIEGVTYISLFSSAGVGCYGFHTEGFHCILTKGIVYFMLINCSKIQTRWATERLCCAVGHYSAAGEEKPLYEST